ncbi:MULTISPECIES: DUF3299 domain-containing protein [Pedobacter]|uniref:DUF3299 domain-containing protein n=1 Tax=Pedobacter TaxID=84567 RepID=UPI00210947A8|nr:MULTISPECIES: DUF3299 domain-containing protein [unclassified Pedobacter]
MKKLLIFALLITGLAAKAQHNPDDQIMSDNWDIVGSVDFKIVKDTDMFPVYNDKIKKLAGKPFELEGYIVPIKDGMKQSRFMLSTLPINQCFYCGKNGVPIMVLVEMADPIKFTYQTVTVKGTLKLNTGNAMDNPPIVLTGAKPI